MRQVSIPERVLEALKPFSFNAFWLYTKEVSIPERVLEALKLEFLFESV